MGSLEIAAEMSMCADYMTAPQDVIGNDEWNYEYVFYSICPTIRQLILKVSVRQCVTDIMQSVKKKRH